MAHDLELLATCHVPPSTWPAWPLCTAYYGQAYMLLPHCTHSANNNVLSHGHLTVLSSCPASRALRPHCSWRGTHAVSCSSNSGSRYSGTQIPVLCRVCAVFMTSTISAPAVPADALHRDLLRQPAACTSQEYNIPYNTSKTLNLSGVAGSSRCLENLCKCHRVCRASSCQLPPWLLPLSTCFAAGCRPQPSSTARHILVMSSRTGSFIQLHKK